MNTRKSIPQGLEDLRKRLGRWRSEHRKGTRIPASFWQEATVLARQYGLSRVSNALGLNYSDLRNRLQPQDDSQPDERTSSTPGFVELKLGALPAASCCVRLERGKGGGVTMTLSGFTADEAIRAAHSLWGAKP